MHKVGAPSFSFFLQCYYQSLEVQRTAEIEIKPTMDQSNYGLNLSRYAGALGSFS